ncbi:Histone transcription regulator 3 [Coemansia javaensis]|uniref:Histone transcription regulator 3 n=1 Tax=Coemansia javaensis TaxID=2761396 RepID=A0A9W8HCU9_9FUNG|nr:Histone transcription regulator 3 [Coemansia javaensis]
MPAFVPINPPAVAGSDGGDGTADPAAPAARIEDEIRGLIQRYQAALRQWREGRHQEAWAGFSSLAGHALLAQEQERHVECECDAYCREHGGLGINRLRALVFANAAVLQLPAAAAAGGQKAAGLLGRPDFGARGLLGAAADPRTEAALCAALAGLETALGFHGDDAALSLAAGQCAMALGRYGAAIAVLGRALGSAGGPQWGPLTWWCARAAVQAALLRGDVDLAVGTIEAASSRSRETSQALRALVDELVAAPARADAPAVLRVPSPPPAPAPAHAHEAPAPPRVVVARARGDAVSIAALGEALAEYCRQRIAEDPGLGSDGALGAVSLELRAEDAEGPAGAARASSPAARPSGGMPDAEAAARADSCLEAVAAAAAAAAGYQSHTDLEETGSGPDCPAKSDGAVPAKRRSSLSGDEMPAKRRSTRFIERAGSGSGSGASAHGAGATGGAAQPGGSTRVAVLKGSARHALAMSAAAVASSAYTQACGSARAWLRAIGAIDGAAAAEALGRCAALADASARQCRPGRHHRPQQARPQPAADDAGVLAEWNLAAHGSRAAGAGTLDEAIQSIARLKASYASSLAANIGPPASAAGENRASRDAREPPPGHSLSAPECRALFEGNCGVFDLLLRYVAAAVAAFGASPATLLGPVRVRRALLGVVRLVHELLLGWADGMLSAHRSDDDHRQGIRCATLALLLLADPAASEASCRQQNDHMRAEWISLAESAIARLGLPSTSACVVQYRVAESWTDYEASAAANDVSRAAASVARCADLLREYRGDPGDVAVARCALSGAAVTLELAMQRQTRLALLGKLETAAELARTDESRAVAYLGSFAEPFLERASDVLAFPQQVAAARLLAALHRRLGNAADEARAVLFELHLYISRLLERSADDTLPARAALGRCVECLQAIHSMAATAAANSGIGRYLEDAASSLLVQRLAGHLALAALAHAAHFEVDPAPERPVTSLEATFAGLAMWLAAKLGSRASMSQPASARGGEVQPVEIRSGEAQPIEIQSGEAQPGDSKPGDNKPGDNKSPNSPSECSDDAGALDCYTRFLDDAHCLLGERGLCTAAEGAFLKHILGVCRGHLEQGSESVAYWDVAGSCLRCLFDVKLHNSSAERHPCARVEMDHESANGVYLLVEAELLATLRSRRGAGMRGDLKAIVDKTCSALGDIDIAQHPRLSMNMDVIDDYLDGATMPTFSQIDQALRDDAFALHTSCVPLRGGSDDLGVPAACLTLPFVRATMQHDLLRFRMRSGLARAIGDYDEIIEDYKLNVSLHPTSAEAWHHLGQAHSDLADELLLGTASEILDSRRDIATLLRSAMSCTLQAKQLLPPLPDHERAAPGTQRRQAGSDDDDDDDDDGDDDDGSGLIRQLHTRVYSLAGRLVYRCAARPLPMLALQILPSNILVSDDAPEDSQAWDVGAWGGSGARTSAVARSLARRYCTPPPRSRVYALAHEMLLRASQLDPASWKWVYLLGKTVAKMGRPLAACALYLKAFHLASAASLPAPAREAALGPPSIASVPEAAMDALCKLLSTLTKLLWARRIDPPTAQRFLDALPPAAAAAERPGDAVAFPSSGTQFAAIRGILEQLCAADRRRWHHRSAFLLAWVDHRAFGSSADAKRTLLGLLQMRSASKQLASFYKTDFEAPGRHYLYLEKYLHLYIEVLVATQDLDGVQLLVRKLRRASEMLYDAPAMVRRAEEAEVATLQAMVRALNCPRLAIDGTGAERVVLQSDLDAAGAVQARAVFRHCRLNRTQFNYARDFARENIALFGAAHQRGSASVSVKDGLGSDELARVEQQLADYLGTANRAITMFGHLLDQKKKHADDQAVVAQLNDCIADVYVLVLAEYGQSRCAAHAPAHGDGGGSPADVCRYAAGLLARAPRPARPGDPFWQCVIFDGARHESSQQYKLLDPLLEFQVNKLLDTAHGAQPQRSPLPESAAAAPQGSPVPVAAAPEAAEAAAAPEAVAAEPQPAQ